MLGTDVGHTSETIKFRLVKEELHLFLTGVLCEGANLYVSRASGDDEWSCSLSKPCKSISKVVNVAECGDHIFIDGTNTDKDPYTCESETLNNLDIYVSKSLSFTGVGPTPQVRCLNGRRFIFNRTDSQVEATVFLKGLAFDNTILTFHDFSAEINGCTFSGSRQRVDFSVGNKIFTSIQIRNSLFWKNAGGFFVDVDNATKQVAYKKQERLLAIALKNTTFRDHCAISETGETMLINVVSKPYAQFFKCQLYLENVVFTNNSFAQMGLVYINLRKGFQDLVLRNIIFKGNHALYLVQDCSELIVYGDNVSVFLSGALFKGQSGRAFKLNATNLTVQVANSSFSGYGVNGNGSALLFSASDVVNATVRDSTFMNIGLSGPPKGGAVHFQCTRITVILSGCVFKLIQATRESAVSVHFSRPWTSRDEGIYQAKNSAEPSLNVHVTDCLFEEVSSCFSRGGALSVVGPVLSVRLLNSTFMNCIGCIFGGAVYVGYITKTAEHVVLDIEDSFFQGCGNNGSLGGPVHVASSRLAKTNIKKTKFLRSFSLGTGGTIAFLGPNWVMKSANKEDSIVGSKIVISIEDSCFTGSESEGYGGAIFIDESISGYNLTVRETNFTNITAGGPGGAIAIMNLGGTGPQVSSNKYIAIINSRFDSNSAGGPGGAIFINPSTDGLHLKIYDTQFSKNNANGEGGSICIFNSNGKHSQLNGSNFMLIESSLFLSNAALGPGGAIFISGGLKSQNVSLKHLLFSRNNAGARGGALSLENTSPANYLTITDAHFIGNTATSPGGGVFLMINFRRVILSNVTIINCKSTKSVGGALYLSQINDKSSLLIENSLLLNNHAVSAGGGLLVAMAPDTLEDAGCIKNGETEKFPRWNYKNKLLLKDTTFRYNTASFGGAVNLQNGRTTFQNCLFEDNFAGSVGGTIYATYGSTSIVIRDSIFLQSKTELVAHKKSFSKSSFIHTESTGPLILQNTTLNAKRNNVGNSLVTVGKGGAVDFGENNLTALFCPMGSDLKFINFSNEITTFTKNVSCKIIVTGLDYSCVPCSAGLYSLQRGQAFGTYLATGFQCLMCPFGANCSKNIAAKPNFWGFEISKHPPALKFTVCPTGYCCPSKQSKTFEYNGCLGNRTGVLCGRCRQGFTETLYSAQCRLIGECMDSWFWPIAAFYILISALYLTFKPPIPSWIKRQILWFKTPKPVIAQDEDYDSGYLKIGFYFYQAGAMLLVSPAHPKHLLETYLVNPIVGLFNFQQKIGSSSGFICPFSGFSVATKSLFSTFHVWGILFMVCILYCLHVVSQKLRCKDSPSPGPYIGGVLQILLLGYTVLGNVSFDLLRCVPVGTEPRMFYDGNVVCFQWWQYAIIVFIVLFTVPFCLVLLWGSMKLHKGSLSAYRFVLACLFPLPALVHWSITAMWGNSRDERPRHPSDVYLTEYVKKVLYDPFKRPVDDKGGSLGWESVLIGRRLILIIVRAFVSDSFPCVMLMTFFSFLFLLHHTAKQPFRDTKANTAESISLLLLTVLGIVNLFPSALLSLAVSSTGPFADWIAFCYWVEIVILGFLPSCFIMFVVIFFISQFCRLIFAVYRFLEFCVGLSRNISCFNSGSEGQRLVAPVH